MFVQSEKFVEAHGGRVGDISVYGQESNHTTWRLANMNLAIRGIDGNLGREHADSFHRDLHPDLKSDFVLANPPFNDSDWRGDVLKEDKRWQFGVPPASNANFAWVQHFIYHLAPKGIAGFVLANGSMSSNQSGEGEIRKNIIEADLVDCMVALPGQLFYSTQIPVCLWFLTRSKNGRDGRTGRTGQRGQTGEAGLAERDRRGETLFIDARNMGTLIDRVHRDLTDEDIAKIADTYHAWKAGASSKRAPGTSESPGPAAKSSAPSSESNSSNLSILSYTDIPGFCKSATLDDIRQHNYILTPGRYVGAAEVEDDGEPFEEKMARLTAELREQMAEAKKLDALIWANLEDIGYGE